MQKFFKQKNKAFTLIETLVAISIFTMSILGLMSVLASSISNTNYAKQKMAATYLAQEGIEYARNMRDTNVLSDTTSTQHGWETFKTANKDYPITNPDFSGFIRTISMSPIGGPITTADEVKIISIVECKKCSNGYSITLSEDLFNWVE